MNRKVQFSFSALWVATLLAVPAWGQSAKLQMNLDHLAKNAIESVTVTLDKSLLKFASKFLSDKDSDQARVKKLIEGLEGVYVRSFQFEKEGEYSMAEVEAIRKQLRTPGWTRMVEIVSKKKAGGENVDVYLRQEGEKVLGMAIVAAQPKQLTVVNIAGPIDIEQLSDLEGHLGIPRFGVEKKSLRTPKAKEKDENEEDD